MKDKFVHLHCHTHYSILDGASRIPELVSHVKSTGMNSISITDHGNMFGAVEFANACKGAGVKPILGIEAYVAPQSRRDRKTNAGKEYAHLTLLAMDRIGFHNLIKLSSIAYTEGYYYKPRIDKEVLEAHNTGVICLSGCVASEFSQLLLQDKIAEAETMAAWYVKVFGDRFYVEIQDNEMPDVEGQPSIQRRHAVLAIELANRMGLPLVVTADAHYLKAEDRAIHDALVCVQTGKKVTDTNRMVYTGRFHVASPAEMYQRFPGQEEAVKRSQEIADRCNVELDKTRHFPVFTPPRDATGNGPTVEQYFRDLCQQGLIERYGATPLQAAQDRLNHELGIICRMGFDAYFLIVWDFVRFACEQGIPANARGSAAGAIVSYCLRISNICPLENGLLFERFLDPNRAEAPDIDIDFCQERREEVITYVRDKYGSDCVAQIGTFNTMAAKAAIKDVGKALGISYADADHLSKLIPKNATVVEARRDVKEITDACRSRPDVARLLDYAEQLEGTNRSTGTHAAGIVIADRPISDYVPLQRVTHRDDEGTEKGYAITTQWSMGDIEKVGLLKMDFLGLRTLTLLKHACDMVRQSRGIVLDLYQIPKDDKRTFELLQRGETRGVFQFEAAGISGLLRRIVPTKIDDITAATSLYRPGPLEGGMVDTFVDCKHGRKKPEYLHPSVKNVTEDTYGVLCYQEQVMQVLHRLGNIELAKAYACIKAISKSKEDLVKQYRGSFVTGAVEKSGLSASEANHIFDLIQRFGGYGFNRAHAAAYAHITYQTAYMKAHYPAEFMAAVLSSEAGESSRRDQMMIHLDDARRHGLTILPADINRSESSFSVENNNVRFGLCAIKGLSRKAGSQVLMARERSGDFTSFTNFCTRMDGRIVNKDVVESLVKIGAFDTFGNRPTLLEAFPKVMKGKAKSKKVLGNRLFPDDDVDDFQPVADWDEDTKMEHEKETLGIYLTRHPLMRHKEIIEAGTMRIMQLGAMNNAVPVRLGGMITDLKVATSKWGGQYARFRFEDFTGTVDCFVGTTYYNRFSGVLANGLICFVEGTMNMEREEPSVTVSGLRMLEEAKSKNVSGLIIEWPPHVSQNQQYNVCVEIAARHPGDRPMCSQTLIQRDDVKKPMWMLNSKLLVSPTPECLDDIERVAGSGAVRLV